MNWPKIKYFRINELSETKHDLHYWLSLEGFVMRISPNHSIKLFSSRNEPRSSCRIRRWCNKLNPLEINIKIKISKDYDAWYLIVTS